MHTTIAFCYRVLSVWGAGERVAVVAVAGGGRYRWRGRGGDGGRETCGRSWACGKRVRAGGMTVVNKEKLSHTRRGTWTRTIPP